MMSKDVSLQTTTKKVSNSDKEDGYLMGNEIQNNGLNRFIWHPS